MFDTPERRKLSILNGPCEWRLCEFEHRPELGCPRLFPLELEPEGEVEDEDEAALLLAFGSCNKLVAMLAVVSRMLAALSVEAVALGVAALPARIVVVQINTPVVALAYHRLIEECTDWLEHHIRQWL